MMKKKNFKNATIVLYFKNSHASINKQLGIKKITIYHEQLVKSYYARILSSRARLDTLRIDGTRQA